MHEPLAEAHIKNRLLGHWGASPGLSFMYVHLNHVIKERDQEAIFLAGSGHGAPGAHVKEKLHDLQIDSHNDAYERGVDKREVDGWARPPADERLGAG